MRLWSVGNPIGISRPVIGRLSETPVVHSKRADTIAYLPTIQTSEFAGDFAGYCGVLTSEDSAFVHDVPAVTGAPNLEYLRHGDVVQLFPDGTVQTLYRRSSPHNSILATERCNSLCLMCSQPPRDVDDQYRVGAITRLLELIDTDAREIGITGGEPTLLGEGFFEIIAKARDLLPATALHVLTNGRLFSDRQLAQRLGSLAHPDMMLGVPLYSDIDVRHDFVVQAKGAYDQTVAGLYNLASSGVRIELRVVLHKQTVDRLPELALFITRNLPFVEHVALMGLEMFGFTLQNLADVWIDPVDYQAQLESATRVLALAGMGVVIFNHQLCTIPRNIWSYAARSISDWKNVYLPECDSCSVKSDCGGFFQSATKRHSRGILPILTV